MPVSSFELIENNSFCVTKCIVTFEYAQLNKTRPISTNFVDFSKIFSPFLLLSFFKALFNILEFHIHTFL